MSGMDGLLYAVGYYKGRSSTYDKRRAVAKKKTTPLGRIGKGILWAICWGFFILAI
jgi:hypothetical protein